MLLGSPGRKLRHRCEPVLRVLANLCDKVNNIWENQLHEAKPTRHKKSGSGGWTAPTGSSMSAAEPSRTSLGKRLERLEGSRSRDSSMRSRYCVHRHEKAGCQFGVVIGETVCSPHEPRPWHCSFPDPDEEDSAARPLASQRRLALRFVSRRKHGFLESYVSQIKGSQSVWKE